MPSSDHVAGPSLRTQSTAKVGPHDMDVGVRGKHYAKKAVKGMCIFSCV